MKKEVKLNFLNTPDKEKAYIKKVVNHVHPRTTLTEPEISLTFVSVSYIQELNKLYRKKNKPTDVLTFCLNETAQQLIDIYVSLDTVKQNARRFKTSLRKELAKIIAHAFAHVVGYDHVTDKEYAIMCEYESFLLKGFNEKII
ncbi:MAG: rRNA maturation RNase YbeY [Candidatus Margulisbacteria bacterium]|nr:rRNA maturation RNase YbeY [Candidatus Margulisiibacteriota bacterium]